MSFHGKKIILGVCGSIAAYKAVYLCREFIKKGAEVRVVMTRSAASFVAPLTFSTLSKHDVVYDLSESGSWNNHVELGLWADIMVIAPVTASTISKMAHGQADNLLLAVYLSAKCPVYFVPAMDLDMWKHPSTTYNVSRLLEYGNIIIPVGAGELASGLSGEGRMAEPEEILQFIGEKIGSNATMQGKKVLITAGPTYEYIDPVRYIGNASSGKMGWALAEIFADAGADIELVLGPVSLHIQHPKIHVTRVTSSDEMFDATENLFAAADIIIFTAAVADYKVATPSSVKIKKKEKYLDVHLVKTIDIAGTLSLKKQKNQTTIGFALETNDALEHAREKLKEKGFDMLILNSLEDAGAGFQHDTNKVTILDRMGSQVEYPVKSKKEVARDILVHVSDLMKKA